MLSPVSIAVELDSIEATAAAASFSSLLLVVSQLLPLLAAVVELALDSVLAFLQSFSSSGEQARFLDAAPVKFGLNRTMIAVMLSQPVPSPLVCGARQ